MFPSTTRTATPSAARLALAVSLPTAGHRWRLDSAGRRVPQDCLLPFGFGRRMSAGADT